MREVDGIGAHALARGRIVIHLAYVAILAIMAAHRIRRCDNTGPDLRRRAFRHTLEAKRRRVFARGNTRLKLSSEFRCNMAAELGLDSSRMQRRRADAAALEPIVERDCIEDVRGLRSAVRGERRILGPLETRIVDIHVADLMTRGGERDDARGGLQQRYQLADG